MFPERLRALRMGKNLSLPELAKQLNKVNDVEQTHKNTGPQIGSWERGTNTPSYIEVRKLANFFNVSLDYLVGQKYQEIDLDDVFASSARLEFAGKTLNASERYEIYALIKGYLRGKYPLESNKEYENLEEIHLDLK